MARGTWRRLDDRVELSIPIRLKHRGTALLISPPEGVESAVSRALLRAVCLTRTWADWIATGAVADIKTLARTQGLCEHYVAKLMPLAWLAPDLVELVLAGNQPRALTLSMLTKHPLPLDWEEQRRLFSALG